MLSFCKAQPSNELLDVLNNLDGSTVIQLDDFSPDDLDFVAPEVLLNIDVSITPEVLPD